MADDQETSNDVGEGGDAPEISDYEDPTTTMGGIAQQTTSSVLDDYDDEPIEDYVVKLVVNEQPDGAISDDIVNAAVTDIHGNIISKTPIYDSINGYTTALYDELNSNGTAITGGKRWWGFNYRYNLHIDNNPFNKKKSYLSKRGSLSSQGWSTKRLLFAGLIALCILGVILAIVFLVLGKNKKKKRSAQPAGSNTTTKSVVTKNIDPKYQQVPNV